MAGTLDSGATAHDFVSTAYHEQLLADLMMSHMVKDMCIVGPRVSHSLRTCRAMCGSC